MVMVTQHVSNNVDACTHCAYLFFALPALVIAIFWMAMAHEHRKGDQIFIK